MDPGSFVIAHLADPKEQFWGRLEELNSAGVTLRGISMSSFEDWARQVARGQEKTMDVVLMFFPMHRVERVFLDEDMGVLPSLARQFHTICGIQPDEYFETTFAPADRAH